MKPKSINKILIPTDFSKTGLLAVQHAAFMAQLNKADLYLLHVIEIAGASFNVYNPTVLLSDNSLLEKAAAEHLAKLSNDIKREYGITVKAICSSGSVTAEIANVAAEYEIDIVVMGTHGAHGFNEVFVGSNAYKTISVCPCPVITVQTKAKKIGFTNIVLPIDDCLISRQKVNFSIKIAKAYAAKIHILGLMNKDGSTDLNKFKIKLQSVEKVIKKAGLVFETTIVRSDNMAVAALKFSRKVKADLISVLADHESEFKGFFGVFAHQVVNYSKVPVLSMRPQETGIYDSVSLAGSNSN